MPEEQLKLAAMHELRRRLANGMYDNTRLPPERELAGTLGIGRRALRLLLDTLEEEGLIWRRQGHGTFAATQRLVSDAEVSRLAHRVNPIEVFEARLSIEPLLVRRAAMRASQVEIDGMMRLAEAARSAADARSYEGYDIAFHRKIAECAGNALFAAIFEMIINVREKADWKQIREYYFEHDGAEQSYAEHRLIIEAIASRDPPGAEKAMRQHLGKVAQSVLGIDGPLA